MAVSFDVIQLFDSGTGTLDATKLAAGAHGASLGTWQVASGYSVDHTVIENHGVTLPAGLTLEVDSVEYDGSEAVGITLDHTGDPGESDVFELAFTSGTYTDMQALALARLVIADTGAPVGYNIDLLHFAGSTYSVAQFQHVSDASQRWKAHTEGGLSYDVAGSGAWVVIGLKHDSTNGIAELYVLNASTGGFIGSAAIDHGSSAGDLIFFRFQDYLRNAGTNTDGEINVKLIALREEVATFPPMVVTVPAVSAIDATQTAVGELLVTWGTACGRHVIERRVDGGAWTTADADFREHVNGFVDTGLTDGASVEYRITAFVGSQSSSSTASGAFVVEDAPFLGGALLVGSPTLGSTIGVTDQRGMKCKALADITITQVGLWVLASQYSDIVVHVYDVSGMSLGSATVDTDGTADQYAYATLTTPIALATDDVFYVMTAPLGYNDIKDGGTVVTPSSAVEVTAAAEGTAPTFYTPVVTANRTFGPVNAIYEFTTGGVPLPVLIGRAHALGTGVH